MGLGTQLPSGQFQSPTEHPAGPPGEVDIAPVLPVASPLRTVVADATLDLGFAFFSISSSGQVNAEVLFHPFALVISLFVHFLREKSLKSVVLLHH